MLDKIKEYVSEALGVDEEEISLTTSFKDDLGADSLDLFELIMALEDEYGIEIDADEMTSVNTVADVIEYLNMRGIEE